MYRGGIKKKKEKGAESLFKEMIAENFANIGQNWIYKVMKLIELVIQCKRSFPGHIIMKLSKTNDKEF